jgi:hypothetical protein
MRTGNSISIASIGRFDVFVMLIITDVHAVGAATRALARPPGSRS